MSQGLSITAQMLEGQLLGTHRSYKMGPKTSYEWGHLACVSKGNFGYPWEGTLAVPKTLHHIAP